MKRKLLFLAIAGLVAAGGLWLAWEPQRPHPAEFGQAPESANRHPASQKSNLDVGGNMPPDEPKPGRMLRPPDPVRRFTDFTPEERVEFARKGHGPGG